MAGARNIKAGGAFVEITAQLDPLKKSLAKGSAMLKTWGSNLASIGSMSSGLVGGAVIGAAAATATAIGAATKAYIDYGSAINDTAARTGVGSTQLQEFAYAAKQTGASLGDVEIALKKMAKGGFSVSQFAEMGEAIAAIPDPSERAARAMEVFGKSGTKLLPMFAEFKNLKAQSAALGPLMTEREVKLADELGDAFGALKEAISRAGQSVAVVFGPQLKAILDTAIGMVVTFNEALRDMRSFGSGGDWLDKIGELSRMSFGDFQKRGAAATGAFSTQTGMQAELDAAEDAGERAAKGMDDMMVAIRKAHEARNQLIQGFETPAENFIRKQLEIVEAIKALHRNRVLGFVSDDEAKSQRRGLDTSLARLRAQEQERLMALMPKMVQQSRNLSTSSRGTFSAAGAALLGRAGDAVEKSQLDELKAIRKAVEKPQRIQGPKFT